ncbi:MAG: hypothetical protein ACHQ4J_15540 [Candidatus Binatia bacterium]
MSEKSGQDQFIYGVHQRLGARGLEPNEHRIRDIVLGLVRHELQGRILETGDLTEQNAPTLVIDLLLGYIRHAAAGYQGPYQAPFLGTALGKFWNRRERRPAYPIRLDEVEESVLWSEYYWHCEHEHFERKREQLRQRGLNSSTIVCTPEDYRAIKERADEAFRRREPIAPRARYIGLEETKRWYSDALRILRSHGINAIEVSTVRNHDMLESVFYQTDRLDLLQQFVEDLWLKYLGGYKALIESNFPTLKNSFALYATMPVRAYIAVDSFNAGKPAGGLEATLGLRIAQVKANGPENEVVICRQLDCRDKGRTDFEVLADGVRVDALSLHFSQLSHVVFSRLRCDPLRLYSLHTPVRKMVYERIREELPSALAELFSGYGVAYAR